MLTLVISCGKGGPLRLVLLLATLCANVCIFVGCRDVESSFPASNVMVPEAYGPDDHDAWMPMIHRAAERGDTHKIEELLQATPNAVDQSLLSDQPNHPLHLAAWQGHVETARALLERGADVNAAGDLGRTPLHYAAQHGHSDVAELLVDHRANLEAKNTLGFTALLTAARGGEVECTQVAELLRRRGAVVDLNCAICLGDVDLVRELLKHPQCVEKSPLPEILLTDAVIMISSKLSEKNARYGEVNLHLAEEVVNAHLDVIQSLIQTHAPKTGSYSALFEAAQLPNTAIAECLLEYGVETSDSSGSNMLGHAVRCSAVAEKMSALMARFGVDTM